MRFLVSRDQPAAPRVANAIPSLLFHTYEKSEVAKLLRFSSKLKKSYFEFSSLKESTLFPEKLTSLSLFDSQYLFNVFPASFYEF